VLNPVWPDIQLLLETTAAFKPQALETAIHAVVQDWNRRQDAGVIHRVGDLQQTSASQFSIRLDMGSTGRDFLRKLLQAIAIPGVERVTIDS
jgi:hypothetical protein